VQCLSRLDVEPLHISNRLALHTHGSPCCLVPNIPQNSLHPASCSLLHPFLMQLGLRFASTSILVKPVAMCLLISCSLLSGSVVFHAMGHCQGHDKPPFCRNHHNGKCFLRLPFVLISSASFLLVDVDCGILFHLSSQEMKP